MGRIIYIIHFLFILSIVTQICSEEKVKRSIFDDLFSYKKCAKDGEKIEVPTGVCCDGYTLTNDSTCVPLCDPGCGDGICVAPNKCDCPYNQTLDLSGMCIPTCPRSCLNGRCLPDGTCECLKGYVLSNDRKFCQPHCPTACPLHMNCTAPGQCSCPTGYEADPQMVGSCKPTCVQNCLGGECAAPNSCFCYPGYKLKDRVCQAECKSGCRNGKCVLRDICTCDPGYTWNVTTDGCDPVCNECENGNCIAPNVCQCYDGYVKRGRICQPHCLDGCANGYCIAPYFCVCRDGYGKDPNGMCLPLDCSTRFTVKECTIHHSVEDPANVGGRNSP